MKLSQWHDGSVKPVHVGVYAVEDEFFSYWDGISFSGCWLSVFSANENKGFYITSKHGCSDITKWRGIVKDKE